MSRKAFVSLKGCGEVRASGLPNTASLARMGRYLGRRVRVGSSAPFAPGGSVRPESLPAPKRGRDWAAPGMTASPLFVPCRPWSALTSLLSLSRLHPPILSPRSANRHSCRCPTLPAVLNPGCQGRCGATLAWLSTTAVGSGEKPLVCAPGPRAVPAEGLFLTGFPLALLPLSSPSAPPPRSVRLSLSSLGPLIPTGAALKVRRSFPFVCPH